MAQVLPAINEIRVAAMNLLAMREHSAKELKSKLERKFSNADMVEAAIASLVEQNLQSDERFVQAFVAMRQRQGKGPVLIRGELREKGIATDLAAEFIDDADVLWIELAREVWCKRFRGVAAGDSRERAKQMRFLQARGFTGHQIKAVFACVSSEA